MNWLRAAGDGRAVLIRVRAQPGAARTEVRGEYGESLKIAVAVPPVDGKANAALIAFLAKRCRLPRAAVTLAHGAGGRDKLFRLEGVEPGEVVRHLLSPASTAAP